MAMVACTIGRIAGPLGVIDGINRPNAPALASGDGSCRPLTTSCPLALAEHRHPAAVGVHAVDVDLVRADHPVDVDQALVAALRRDLRRRQAAAVEEAFRIALAERDVAGGVLVEQRVEEQTARSSRSARNAAPAPPRRAGARPRRCRAPCSALPRRARPSHRRCGLPRTAPRSCRSACPGRTAAWC